MARIVAVYGHVGSSGPQQVVLSDDDGRTWTETGITDNQQWHGRMLDGPLGLMIGTTVGSFFSGLPERAVIPLTDDGETWTGGAIEPADWDPDNDYYIINTFGKNVGITFAGGNYFANLVLGDFGFLLRSDNGGPFRVVAPTGFATGSVADVRAILALQDGQTWVVAVDAAGNGTLRRSTDNGDSWSSITVPQPTSATSWDVYDIIEMSPGRLVAVGGYIISGGNQKPFSAISTDSGATWSTNSTPVSGLTYPSPDAALGGGQRQHFAKHIVKVTAEIAVMSLEGNPNFDSFKHFAVSMDAGASFDTPSTYHNAFGGNSGQPQQLILSPTGAVLGTIHRIDSSPVVGWNGEVWRGELNADATALEWRLATTISDTVGFCNGEMAGIAWAPDVEEEVLVDQALTGRNDMLVLSSSTGKWGHYAY